MSIQRIPGGGQVSNNNNVTALENEVNLGIQQGLLGAGTRSAINAAFGLRLKPGPRQSLPEHRVLMQTVRRSGIDDNDARIVGRFLDHLERQGLAWSVVSTNPAVLQAVVNGAITHQGLRSETRPALNRSFNLTLRGPTGLVRLAPFLPEHSAVGSHGDRCNQSIRPERRHADRAEPSLQPQFARPSLRRRLIGRLEGPRSDPRPCLSAGKPKKPDTLA